MNIDRNELGRIVRYIAVGGVAASLHYLVALGLVYGLSSAPGLANACGFLAGFVVSYLGQSRLTFRYKGAAARAMPRWFMVAASGLVLSSLGVQALTHYGVWPSLALALAVLLVPIFSYLLGRFWVFTER